MDPQPPPATSIVAPKWRWLFAGFFALALAAYAGFISRNIGAYAAGADSSGYLNNAKLLSDGKARTIQRSLRDLPPGAISPLAYVPFGFRPTRGDEMAPTYPTGLPLIYAAAAAIIGWENASPVTIILHALAGAVLCYLLARTAGLSCGFAAIGALIVAMSPQTLFAAFQNLSDLPSLVWVTGAVLLAWRSRERASNATALAAGAVFAVAVLMRPTNFLAIVPLAIALGLHWKRWTWLGLGGLPGAVFLAFYNRAAYGEMLASGYSDISVLLKTGVLGATLAHYARWLPILLTPVAVLALGIPWLVRSVPRRVALLTAWFAAFAGFYAFYVITQETWWCLRFLLPAFPAIVVAALLVLDRLTRPIRPGVARWIPGMVLALAVVLWSLKWTERLQVYTIGPNEQVYREAMRLAAAHLPDDAVVGASYTSGALFFYTDLTIIRWDTLKPADAAAIEKSLAASRRPLCAVLFPDEEKGMLEERFPGNWTEIAAARHVTVWRRDTVTVPSER